MTALGSGLVASLPAQTPVPTIASVFRSTVAWGQAATAYKKRQWEKSRDELLATLVGSTISVSAKINPRDITRSGGAASYEVALPIGPSYTDDLADWNIEELAPIWTAVRVAETVAFRFTTIAYLVIQLTDNSDQLTGTLTGTGKITNVSVGDSQVTIRIDITGGL